MNALRGQDDWKVVTPREKRVVLDSGSWHNKTGDIIRQIHEGVWVIERGYIFLGTIDVGGRTTLIRLPSGGLFVHAPLALTGDLKRAIDQIGEVSVVVAPNTEHVDFVAQWKIFYPSATYLGPPDSLGRLPQIPFTRELSGDGTLDESMKAAPISQFFIACAPFFRETLFIHRPSRSLLCTDFFWAYPTGREVPRPTLAWSWAMNRVYKPIYDVILINNQKEFCEILNAVLVSDFDEIIPCHGDIVTTNGKEVLRNFFGDKLRDMRRT